MEGGSQVELPVGVQGAFDVFVSGVEQHPGVDYSVDGRLLVFNRQLAREGKLGFWRWLSIFLGIAGTYRKNETVDVVYTVRGQREVASLTPREPPAS